MVRAVNDKYNVWIAGYYDDFTGARAVPQDMNTPNTDNDASASGILHLFDPSNTTFVKHFMGSVNVMTDNPATDQTFLAGYFNTTSAIDAIQFKMASGNIDSGVIKMYGVL